MISHHLNPTALLLVGLVLLPGTAFASDGLGEINQACAVNTGCFPGDTPGFPVTVTSSAPASLILTSNLNVPDENTTGISFSAGPSGYSLNLNGFAIAGVTTCLPSGGSVNCSPTGTGEGIVASNSPLTVHNGQVMRFGSSGIRMGFGSLAYNLQLLSNGGTGIITGQHSMVRDAVSRLNGAAGFVVSSRATAVRCTSTENGDTGFQVGSRSTVESSNASNNFDDGISAGTSQDTQRVVNNSVISNGGVGILLGNGAVIEGNVVSLSDEDGISAGAGSVIRGNAVYNNGVAVPGDGIHCTLGCRVSHNTARDNTNAGLRFDTASSAYSDNTIGSNDSATVIGGTDAGGNLCDLSLNCP